jgi:hypothetical protein
LPRNSAPDGRNDEAAFFFERLAGLRAGIIELARLADDDRAGADDEKAVDVSALGHLSIFDLRLPIYDLETVQNATDETRIETGAKAKSRLKQIITPLAPARLATVRWRAAEIISRSAFFRSDWKTI